MKKTVICIGRQYGSGGREIGEKLAKELGLICYDKLLLKKAADQAGVDLSAVETNDEKPLGLSSIVSGNVFADTISMSSAFYSEQQMINEAMIQTITDIATSGSCVIIGRCASSILRDTKLNVLSVFIYGDNDDRVRRIAERNSISIKAATKKMQKVDRMRRKFFDFYSDTPWGDPSSYDLMISSSRYGIDGTVKIIKNTLEQE